MPVPASVMASVAPSRAVHKRCFSGILIAYDLWLLVPLLYKVHFKYILWHRKKQAPERHRIRHVTWPE